MGYGGEPDPLSHDDENQRVPHGKRTGNVYGNADWGTSFWMLGGQMKFISISFDINC